MMELQNRQGATTETTAGFSYAMDHNSARRQWHMSVGIIVILGFAILAATMTFPPVPVTARADVAFLRDIAVPAGHTTDRDGRS